MKDGHREAINRSFMQSADNKLNSLFCHTVAKISAGTTKRPSLGGSCSHEGIQLLAEAQG